MCMLEIFCNVLYINIIQNTYFIYLNIRHLQNLKLSLVYFLHATWGKIFVFQFIILYLAFVGINFETALKIGNRMECLQIIVGLSDGSGEINNGKTAYILRIWRGVCTFIV